MCTFVQIQLNQAKAATCEKVMARRQRGSQSPWHYSARIKETKAKVEKIDALRPAVLRPWKGNRRCLRQENEEATTVAESDEPWMA